MVVERSVASDKSFTMAMALDKLWALSAHARTYLHQGKSREDGASWLQNPSFESMVESYSGKPTMAYV
jgi:hypothetical protein